MGPVCFQYDQPAVLTSDVMVRHGCASQSLPHMNRMLHWIYFCSATNIDLSLPPCPFTNCCISADGGKYHFYKMIPFQEVALPSALPMPCLSSKRCSTCKPYKNFPCMALMDRWLLVAVSVSFDSTCSEK